MDRFATLTGRQYRLFDYFGAADADRVIVLMGSGAETARETIEYLNARGAKLGVVQVHLFRPFSVNALLDAVPAHGEGDRGARSHARSRARRRAALPGRRHGLRRGDAPTTAAARCRASSAAATGCRRRSSRRRW